MPLLNDVGTKLELEGKGGRTPTAFPLSAISWPIGISINSNPTSQYSTSFLQCSPLPQVTQDEAATSNSSSGVRHPAG